ncbi:Hypothetical protein GLP15_541 [Giardia lamblia P15]|uniref:Uncharacterized protein n=1 Tax=Giardia intestinalis (strain P15) TaxID=658858 RepID=E1F8J2_GIAIA|nr:Hypothetical protein GLP15_541 [Giardia lamblia P15]
MTSAEWFQAVRAGNLEYITTHIEDLSCSINECGETALMCAVRQKNIKMITHLIEHESRCINSYGQSALIIAIMEHFQDAVEALLPHEYDMGAIPGQLSPLNAAVDCGDDDVLALVLKHGKKSAENNFSANHTTLSQQMNVNRNNEDSESASPRLSFDPFRIINTGAINTSACRISSGSTDLDLCKAAIWRLANKAIKSHDEFESQFMAVQKRMEDVILRYKQEMRTMRKVLELAGIDGKDLENYLQQAKLTVGKRERISSPQSISICDAIRLDSALTPPMTLFTSDVQNSSRKQATIEPESLCSPCNTHQEADLAGHAHSIDSNSLPQHLQVHDSNLVTFIQSPEPNPHSQGYLQMIDNHQENNNSLEKVEDNEVRVVSKSTIESLLTTYTSLDKNHIFGGEGEPDDLESQIKLLSEDIKDLSCAMELFEGRMSE